MCRSNKRPAADSEVPVCKRRNYLFKSMEHNGISGLTTRTSPVLENCK